MNPALDKYCSEDFSRQGAAATELMQSVANEASSASIKLSDHVGSIPANLTGVMVTWFLHWVRPLRYSALESIEAHLKNIDQTQHGNPTLTERECDRAQDEMLEAKRQAIRSEQDKNKTEYQKLEKLRIDEDKARSKFETLRTQHNREPVIPNPFIYWGLLVCIGLAEVAINFESFSSIDWFTPLVASGTTVVVALALALSSHFIGVTIRQIKERFSPAGDDTHLFSGPQMLGIGVPLLGVALAVVAYSRFYFLAATALANTGFGIEAPSMVKIVGGSMLSNLLVWLVGVVIAYMMHDVDPAFPDSKKALAKAEAKREHQAKLLEKPLQKEFERLDAVYRKKLHAINTSSVSLSSLRAYREAQEMMQRLKEHDARVISLLSLYRQALLRSEINSNIRFLACDKTREDQTVELTPTIYSALDLSMKFN